MKKTLVGSQLRQLRKSQGETQAQMAARLGISPAYVNLLESNQRSLSVQVLVAITEAYGVDWRDLVGDGDEKRIPELRAAMRDPIFSGDAPDLQELRAAIEHAPRFVSRFLQIYDSHHNLTDRLSRQAGTGHADDLLSTTPGTAIHDFFRDHENYFDELDRAAGDCRNRIGGAADDMYASLKRFLRVEHGVSARLVSLVDMRDTLRVFDRTEGEVRLSEALDHPNRVFQLAHVVGLLTCQDIVDQLVESAGLADEDGRARLGVELMNYFAGALLMPYESMVETAEFARYDIDRLASAFSVSFEQVCHRLTTLQRDGRRGVPFFFLRVDRAGNVTKRFNATPFTLAEQGGSCPVWNIHAAFGRPGVVVPQFVELPGGGRFFTLSRTTDRPVFDRNTQDRRLVIALGCESEQADRVCYAEPLNTEDRGMFTQIGISCHVCPRQACSQRAHQPLNIRLRIHADRRGSTRYES
ncbi:helix-turn-helix domain-containing protein [Marimonas arenosa]|uniref:Short-chain fatty acyl-CoA regulator family protein n=1 Tax=Marimonas arenosa TaxID=1795305 RepID=A0AAE4B6N4_9RHOB|nr:helix-turn-helix transcriptional regulator [Marimonas arenosa]MDQ2092287.1 short-chain fatty acyl-CoA regulator family protein [Marimonas arenosa]